jgi:2-polyprenyl-3-methyl-5-hydroxy-6-metoxy-1,4-benzoquinol methylase
MDKETIRTYNSEAESIAQLHSILIPYRIYELVEQYFIKDEATIDIGCGIGRDTHWLNQKGFPTIGVDASDGMIKQARQRYPDLAFQLDYLPILASFENSQFQNILCSAVLMHLTNDLVENACLRLLHLLKTNGRLIISIRGTNNQNNRESGKLYESINIESFGCFFEKHDCDILLYESNIEQKRQLTWHNFVVKK